MSTRLKVGFVSVLSCLALVLGLFASTGIASAHSTQALHSQTSASASVSASANDGCEHEDFGDGCFQQENVCFNRFEDNGCFQQENVCFNRFEEEGFRCHFFFHRHFFEENDFEDRGD